MTTRSRDVYIVSAVRTPVGKANRGVFNRTRPDDLLAHVIKKAMQEIPTIGGAEVDDVIIGCAMPEAEQGMNVARIATLLAGLPDSVPAMTVNRFCSSGLQTIALGAQRIAAGEAEVIIAGGTESMSMVPLGGHKMTFNPAIFAKNNPDVAIAYGMGITAEKVAERWQITRDMQDEFALASHQKAIKAIEQGLFQREIAPFTVVSQRPDLQTGELHTIEREIAIDEGPRASTSFDALSNLKPAFSRTGTVTAGNSSQTSDGAGAVVLVSERILTAHNLKPLAKFCGFSVAGVPAEIMGIGPIYAVPKLLQQTGVKLDDIQWIELNEAFAAQSLAVIKDLKLNPEIVNPQGGAIALGHPLGATGAIRAATIIHGLRRTQKRYGLVTMCIGTGMGAAGLFEAL
jgi:acetyl-CoA acyltransferase